MGNQLQNQQVLPSFSFSTIFYGRPVSIDIVSNEGCYRVFLNGEAVAQLKLNEEIHNWFVVGGELDDNDLVHDIGERLDARYYDTMYASC